MSVSTFAPLHPIFKQDSYKYSHYLQYPEGATETFSYVAPRGGKHEAICVFGLQMFVKKCLLKPLTMHDVDVAERKITAHGEPFNRRGFERIVTEHGGYLPLRIRSVPEGSIIPNKDVVATVESTDEELPWVTSFVETSFLRGIWYPSTVSTISCRINKEILQFLEQTGTPELLPFKLHDFGYRGVSSDESGEGGGLAHLVHFKGTDTIGALEAAEEFYGTFPAGFSIPAAEHSTMTMLGKEGQKAQFERMINTFGGEGKLYAMVIDGYNVYEAVDLIGNELQQLIRKKGGTCVVRPDSGDPVEVVVKVVKQLDAHFGSTMNAKGYKVLDPVIRVIQGDGVDEKSIVAILQALKDKGYSADNIAFGMGGALLQKLNRDTDKWAMKCSAAKVNGIWLDVFKDPITDSGKTSLKGRLELIRDETGYHTVRREELAEGQTSLLRDVYLDGKLLVDETLDTIRDRANLARKGL